MFEPATILFNEEGQRASDNSSAELVLSIQMFCCANKVEVSKHKDIVCPNNVLRNLTR
jgi:hypothetical protein